MGKNWNRNELTSQLNLSQNEVEQRRKKYLASLKCVWEKKMCIGKRTFSSSQIPYKFSQFFPFAIQNNIATTRKWLRKNRKLVCKSSSDAVPRFTASARLKINNVERWRYSKTATSVSFSSIPIPVINATKSHTVNGAELNLSVGVNVKHTQLLLSMVSVHILQPYPIECSTWA